MRRNLLIVPVLLAAATWCGSAKAQTAEEAVMFITQGYYEDSAIYSLMPGGSHLDYLVRRTSPTSWEHYYINEGRLAEPDKPRHRVKIIRLSTCMYEITDFNLIAGGESVFTFNFENVTQMQATTSAQYGPDWNEVRILGANLIHLQIVRKDGSIQTDTEQNVMGALKKASVERMSAAIDFFRKKICKGRQF